MKHPRLRTLSACVCLFFSTALAAIAQSSSATIVGRVVSLRDGSWFNVRA